MSTRGIDDDELIRIIKDCFKIINIQYDKVKLLKSRYKITIISFSVILAIFLAGIFSTPSFFEYKEGIGLMMQKTYEPLYDENNKKYPIYQFTEEDYEKVPKIKDMMDILLTLEYVSGDRERSVHYGPDTTKYKVRAGIGDISIQGGMPSMELAIYNKWMNSKSTFLVEYEGVIFHVLNFKISH